MSANKPAEPGVPRSGDEPSVTVREYPTVRVAPVVLLAVQQQAPTYGMSATSFVEWLLIKALNSPKRPPMPETTNVDSVHRAARSGDTAVSDKRAVEYTVIMHDIITKWAIAVLMGDMATLTLMQWKPPLVQALDDLRVWLHDGTDGDVSELVKRHAATLREVNRTFKAEYWQRRGAKILPDYLMPELPT